MIKIGDIVRVVLSSKPMSIHKRHLINEIGLVVKGFEDWPNTYLIQFFQTNEKVVFYSEHLIKEEDWINRIPLEIRSV
jgi:hypothetical protein